jgi:hypothetical protein
MRPPISAGWPTLLWSRPTFQSSTLPLRKMSKQSNPKIEVSTSRDGASTKNHHPNTNHAASSTPHTTGGHHKHGDDSYSPHNWDNPARRKSLRDLLSHAAQATPSAPSGDLTADARPAALNRQGSASALNIQRYHADQLTTPRSATSENASFVFLGSSKHVSAPRRPFWVWVRFFLFANLAVAVALLVCLGSARPFFFPSTLRLKFPS